MIKPKIKKIIIKYITDSLSDNENDLLLKWLDVPENKLLFKDFILTNYAIDYNLNDLNTDALHKALLFNINKDKSIYYKYRLNTVFKYAALFLVFLGLSYAYYQKDTFTEDLEPSILNISNEAITLQLDNGKIAILNEEKSSHLKDEKGNILGTQHKTKLVYKTKKDTKAQALVYNTLWVPYGKRFEIELSDGTTVFLNSGTSFKYPVEFIEGKDRLVYVKGEAFFDVAKDKEHPFIVNANDLNIRVLGTKFNVSCYPEDININTVLAEGAVNLYDNNENYNPEKTIALEPGYKATWNTINHKTSLEEVDVALYTAWIDGRVIFRHMTFNNIIKILERHYNVDIINNNKTLGSKFFTAKFDVETINQVLKSFSENYAISYIIKNNKVIIN